MTWSLLELFVNMDLARMSELNVDKCMNAFDATPWNMGVERPGDISNGSCSSSHNVRSYPPYSVDFYYKLAWNLERIVHVPLARDAEGADWPRYDASTLTRLLCVR